MLSILLTYKSESSGAWHFRHHADHREVREEDPADHLRPLHLHLHARRGRVLPPLRAVRGRVPGERQQLNNNSDDDNIHNSDDAGQLSHGVSLQIYG